MNGHIKLLLLSTMFAGFILSGCSQAISAGDPSLSPELPQPAPAFTAASDPDSISNACKKIIFSMVDQSKGENPDIYSVCPDGSGLTQLTKDPAVDTFPAWSPDGKRISFASARAGGLHIYIMDQDTDNLLQLTFDHHNDRPLWLPNGQQIAFLTTDGTGLWWWRIAELETGQITQFTEPNYDFFYQTPAWSPDGLQIAYMSMKEQAQRNDGSSQIHVRNIDGSNDVALTNDTWANINPIWSPTGEKIAFLSERDGNYNMFALYIMDNDGTNVERLTEPIYSDGAIFTWSSDGQQIAFGDKLFGNIIIIDIKTGNQRELLILDDGQTAFGPSWQP